MTTDHALDTLHAHGWSYGYTRVYERSEDKVYFHMDISRGEVRYAVQAESMEEAVRLVGEFAGSE